MAILTKAKPKKCECGRPAGSTATGVSACISAARTLAPSSSEESAMRREMTKVQLAMMKADLRKHVADAVVAEIIAARTKAYHKAQPRK